MSALDFGRPRRLPPPVTLDWWAQLRALLPPKDRQMLDSLPWHAREDLEHRRAVGQSPQSVARVLNGEEQVPQPWVTR